MHSFPFCLLKNHWGLHGFARFFVLTSIHAWLRLLSLLAMAAPRFIRYLLIIIISLVLGYYQWVAAALVVVVAVVALLVALVVRGGGWCSRKAIEILYTHPSGIWWPCTFGLFDGAVWGRTTSMWLEWRWCHVQQTQMLLELQKWKRMLRTWIMNPFPLGSMMRLEVRQCSGCLWFISNVSIG